MRTPQVCPVPALMASKESPGGEACPNRLSPQHSTVLSAFTQHVHGLRPTLNVTWTDDSSRSTAEGLSWVDTGVGVGVGEVAEVGVGAGLETDAPQNGRPESPSWRTDDKLAGMQPDNSLPPIPRSSQVSQIAQFHWNRPAQAVR